jgi:hypothetical protein
VERENSETKKGIHRDRWLLINCLCDEGGTPLLKMEDSDQLANLDSRIANELVSAAWNHISFSEEAVTSTVKN